MSMGFSATNAYVLRLSYGYASSLSSLTIASFSGAAFSSIAIYSISSRKSYSDSLDSVKVGRSALIHCEEAPFQASFSCSLYPRTSYRSFLSMLSPILLAGFCPQMQMAMNSGESKGLFSSTFKASVRTGLRSTFTLNLLHDVGAFGG